MPKSPSRTSKKKKYNARFPPARIKKIMQTDEEVGKVAAAVPVIISRALELFIESLITETSKTTVAKNAKTLSTSHIKQTIENNKQFDFLRDLVANVPDHQTEDNGDAVPHDGERTTKKSRGRLRKTKDSQGGKKQRGESSKATSDSSEEDYDDEEDEDTETDEEGTAAASSAPMASSAPQVAYSNPNDRLLPSTMSSSSTSGPNVYMNNPENFNPSHSPAFINPAMASIQKQQQQLQPHHQFQQQQQQQQQNQPGETLPAHAGQAFPPYMSRPPQSMGNYPLPPQFPNSYTPMPSSQHQNPHHQIRQQLHSQLLRNQQQRGVQYSPNMPMSQDQGIFPSPNQQLQNQHFVQQQQPQPMNLSYSSRAMATTGGDDEDYDT